jgi:hypothetical protein
MAASAARQRAPSPGSTCRSDERVKRTPPELWSRFATVAMAGARESARRGPQLGPVPPQKRHRDPEQRAHRDAATAPRISIAGDSDSSPSARIGGRRPWLDCRGGAPSIRGARRKSGKPPAAFPESLEDILRADHTKPHQSWCPGCSSRPIGRPQNRGRPAQERRAAHRVIPPTPNSLFPHSTGRHLRRAKRSLAPAQQRGPPFSTRPA